MWRSPALVHRLLALRELGSGVAYLGVTDSSDAQRDPAPESITAAEREGRNTTPPSTAETRSPQQAALGAMTPSPVTRDGQLPVPKTRAPLPAPFTIPTPEATEMRDFIAWYRSGSTVFARLVTAPDFLSAVERADDIREDWEYLLRVEAP